MPEESNQIQWEEEEDRQGSTGECSPEIMSIPSKEERAAAPKEEWMEKLY